MASFMDIQVGGWNVGSVGRSAGVFVGENLQYGWRFTEKSNSASPAVIGDYNIAQSAVNRVEDVDVLDTWIQKSAPLALHRPPSVALQRALARREREIRASTHPSRTRPALDDLDW